jgi:hypothetical protein
MLLLAMLLLVDAFAAPQVESRQVLAAVRAFAYDRHLVERIGAEVQLAVVHSAGGAPSGQQIGTVLGSLGAFTIHDRPVKVILMDIDTFLASAHKVDVALIAPGCGARVPDIAAAASAHGVLTAGFALDDVQHGIVIAVVEGPDRLRLVVDLDAGRAVGAAFSSQLLQLAEIQQ